MLPLLSLYTIDVNSSGLAGGIARYRYSLYLATIYAPSLLLICSIILLTLLEISLLDLNNGPLEVLSRDILLDPESKESSRLRQDKRLGAVSLESKIIYSYPFLS